MEKKRVFEGEPLTLKYTLFLYKKEYYSAPAYAYIII